MGNYVGYFYPVELSSGTNSASSLNIEDSSFHQYEPITNAIKVSNKYFNFYQNRKNAVSRISTTTDDSLSRSDDVDTDKSIISQSVYFEDNVNESLFPQNIFYYDWDDTLFFTTALKSRFFEYCGNFYSEENKANNLLLTHFKKEITNLDLLSSTILSKSVSLGSVYIVTNSSLNWVYSMAKEYYPRTYNYIISNKIQVISARDNYSSQFPNEKYLWKTNSFMNIANNFNYDKTTNIISLGDNQLDIDAAEAASIYFNKSYVKTVKLRERPSFEELTFQLEEYLFRFDEIVECSKNYNYIL